MTNEEEDLRALLKRINTFDDTKAEAGEEPYGIPSDDDEED